MTNSNNLQAALDRLEALRLRTAEMTVVAEKLVEIAVTDASKQMALNPTMTNFPTILMEEHMVELVRLKNDLLSLSQYYDKQKDELERVVEQRREQTVTRSAEQTEVVIPKTFTAEELRARYEKLSSVSTTASEVDDVQEEVQTPASQPEEPAGLPAAVPVSDQPANPNLPTPGMPENNVQRLSGERSPLLDIFAPSPWLPNGRGTITVGSEGFNWHKLTNPLSRQALDRAKLPNGFYAGEDRPAYVVLRLMTCIVIWDFTMNAENIMVFAVGLSDANKEDVRWFKLSELSSTWSRRLITELAEKQHQLATKAAQ